MKKYFRLGEIPKNERSIAFNKMTFDQVDSVSCLLDTGELEQAYAEVPKDALEPGVSVFDLDGDDCPNLNNIRLVRSFCARLGGGKDFLGKVIAPHSAYIVSGDEVARGHDGEPLIRNVRILEKLDTDPEVLLTYAVSVMKENFGFAEQGERLDSSRQLYVFYLKVNRITGEKVLRWEASGDEWERLQYTEYVLGGWSFRDPLNDNFAEK